MSAFLQEVPMQQFLLKHQIWSKITKNFAKSSKFHFRKVDACEKNDIRFRMEVQIWPFLAYIQRKK